MSRAAETLAGIPLATRCTMGACIAAYAYQLLFDPPLHRFTMCPKDVLRAHQYYRIVTSSLFHGSVLHIGMNMMSTMAIGTMLEKEIGTLMMAATVSWGILLTSGVYILISWLLFAVLGYEQMMLQHSVGFSGVIFQLSVLESSTSPNRTRSVFGVFRVSSRMYPWALLVVLQFVMPQVSFLGHLAGILVGTLQYYGVLDALFPSGAYLRECNGSDGLEALRRQPGYVPAPDAGVVREPPPDVRSALLGACGGIALLWKNACETIKVCIFGRGDGANANIQLGDIDLRGSFLDENVEDDEEWVGLPAAIHRSTEEV